MSANSCCLVKSKESKDETQAHQSNLGNSTKAIHGGSPASHWTYSPIIPPLYMTSTFETLEPGKCEYEYSRCDNPTRTELQKYLADLESAKYALAFSSGLGALTTVSYLLVSGQHVLCSDDVYGGTNRFFNKCLSRMGIETTFVDGSDVGNWAKSFRKGSTKLVWIETPTNPTMKIVDVRKIVKEIKSLDPECTIVVDNTFMTPINQSPLEMGADVVMHSCTKYINGHSDVIMGALMTNREDLHSQLKFMQNSLGITPSPFDCWQVIRSIKTLNLRVKHMNASALKVAKFLEANQHVRTVLYPGLESHPQHEIAKREYRGFGGIITFSLDADAKPGQLSEAIKLVQAVKICHLAVSLGCVCTLIEIPSLMTHSALEEAERQKLGIHENMIRLSVGLEDVDDLIADLDQALKAAFAK